MVNGTIPTKIFRFNFKPNKLNLNLMFFLRINFWFGSTFCGSCLGPFPVRRCRSVQGRAS